MNFDFLLKEKCENRLAELGWTETQNNRLKDELSEILARDESQYWLKNHESNNVWTNEHNGIVPFLLGCCKEFDPERPTNCDYGDFPDIDSDFATKIKDYLKNDYSPKQFGQDKVCNICTYTKFGIRSALIDIARILGLNRNEILKLTKSLEVKDDEGEVLTWDKALELYDDLREYLKLHPDLAEGAKKLIGRVRGIGVHASGLIISGVTIQDHVPLVTNKLSNLPLSAWTQGLSDSELGAVGLVKFDFLGLDATQKIGQTIHYIEKLINENNHPNTESYQNFIKNRKISAIPGQGHWSDKSYLNDPKAMTFAQKGDLKMIFQFDGSPGIRKLAKEAKADCFDDLAVITALYRPGPMKKNAHTSYCKRKLGQESWDNMHPKLKTILKKTYGLLIYQESCMKVLHEVGNIPLKDCEMIRKAISNKKVEKFKKYQEQFIINGQKNLNYNESQIIDLWETIEAFAGYSFNSSHCIAYATISSQELYLKVHFPEAYLPAYLDNFHPTGEEDYNKMKEYLIEIKKAKIIPLKTNFNESKSSFRYKDGKIYYSFNKLKGIGEESALMIEKGQPFIDIEDFLDKCGSDAKISKALIGTEAIPGNRLALWEYYEKYKEWKKRKDSCEKNFAQNTIKFNLELKQITGEEFNLPLNNNSIQEIYLRYSDGHKFHAIINKIMKSYHRTINTYLNRKNETKPSWKDFVPTGNIEDIEIKKLFTQPQEEADLIYYGFKWNNPIENAIGISTQTFEELELSNENSGPIEAIIKKIEIRTGPKVTYYSLQLEDSMEIAKYVTIWESDFKQFSEELIVGNIIRINLTKPEPGTRFNYNLKSTPNRWKLPPKYLDHRIVTLKKGTNERLN